jgi:hypothetical protein
MEPTDIALGPDANVSIPLRQSWGHWSEHNVGVQPDVNFKVDLIAEIDIIESRMTGFG